jgi:hypothetical protein
MFEEAPSPDDPGSKIRLGVEIIENFVASLKNDGGLDKATVEIITTLVKDERLTLTNLLRLLEEARGKTSI